ncbi:hypothetical protein [Burkholderia sp. SRS-W-2-2016]|uniref:hypothetical protein n=1 Tax=Burkholderia sp. SRS-W-2-2016 TaxID=1926878 RepID=UPI00117EAE0A|nr:hypothetical protein [Burkholderia sp. SRS-W-2-2016]
MIDRVPVAGSGGGFDWLGAVGAVAGAALGSVGFATSGSAGAGESTNSTLLGDAQPFEYSENTAIGDTFDTAGLARTPNLGEPGTWHTNPGSGQMRLYGDTGAPVIDLDFDHLHNGLRPHAHNWNNGVRDGGSDVVPFSPWAP